METRGTRRDGSTGKPPANVPRGLRKLDQFATTKRLRPANFAR